jgi:hypothetical protein
LQVDALRVGHQELHCFESIEPLFEVLLRPLLPCPVAALESCRHNLLWVARKHRSMPQVVEVILAQRELDDQSLEGRRS